ncbi:MAG TPA: hypothetical protein VFM66_03960, partial [Agromyces sp.]|nr:hypothetical protein [Agromyces sp.]
RSPTRSWLPATDSERMPRPGAHLGRSARGCRWIDARAVGRRMPRPSARARGRPADAAGPTPTSA